jgi:DNA-directed RNA polymerase specialized sigma24 family protein
LRGAWRRGQREDGIEDGPGTRGGDELLARARSGDDAAFEELFAEHADSARRLAVILAGPDVADDLVSESFTRVLGLLRNGRGPTSNFRAYPM